MNFRQWLHLQESSYVTRTREMIYPPPADGLAGRSSKNYRELESYKGQLRAAHKIDRTLINIDPKTVYDIPYCSPEALEMPGESNWVHQSDDGNRPALRIDTTRDTPEYSIEGRSLPDDRTWRHKKDDGSKGAVKIIRK